MPKCDFNKVAFLTLRHGCSPVNLLHIYRTPFPKNTPRRLLLPYECLERQSDFQSFGELVPDVKT